MIKIAYFLPRKLPDAEKNGLAKNQLLFSS